MPIFNSRDVVFQDWMFRLPMQQQSVLLLAARGPDGVGKFHSTKPLVARYRATVLKAAYLGRAMNIDECDDTTFMTLHDFSDDAEWKKIVAVFFNYADEIQHHYLMHFAHGAEIIGYKHPNDLFRRRWRGFYEACCRDWHVPPESEIEMDARLNDWGRAHWDRGPDDSELTATVNLAPQKFKSQDLIATCDALRDRLVPRDLHLVPEHEPQASWPKTIIAPRMEDGLLEDVPGTAPTAPWALIKVQCQKGATYYNVDRRKYARDEVDALAYLAPSANNKEWEETEAWYQGMYNWDGDMWRLRKEFFPQWVRP